MTVAALRLDFNRSRRATRWSMIASFVVHVLLLVWLTTLQMAPADRPVVTEITLLSPEDFAASAPVSTPAAPGLRSVSGMAAASSQDVHFERPMVRGEVAVGAKEGAVEDRMEARLAAMQRSAPVGLAGTATAPTPTALLGSRAATIPGPGGSGSAPLQLVRDGSAAAAPLELSRSAASGAPAALAPTTAAPAPSQADAPANASETTAQRTVAGASLMGPVADRPVLAHPLPSYPEWAKKEAVEGSVTLYFVVRPNGSVKENVLIQKTAGFGDFDENARVAIRTWRFEPLKNGRAGEQWGTITFHYRLRDAG